MNISFVIGEAWEVATLEDIKKLDEWAFDRSTYYLIKALEKNEDFEKAVKNARKALHIPEKGYEWSWYENKWFDAHTNPSSFEETQVFGEWFAKIKNEAEKVYEVLDLHPAMKEMLPYILVGNFVYPTGVSISTESKYAPGSAPRTSYAYHIVIQNKISKHELITFIESNWEKIAEDITDLPRRPELYISSRDMMIIELHDQEKLPFRTIADRIIEIFKIDDVEDKINEDSMKNAYHRAKAKIALLGKHKK